MWQRNLFVFFPVHEERNMIDDEIRFCLILCIKSNRSFDILRMKTILDTFNSKHDFINIQQQHIMLTVQLFKN